ncbi:XdhC family protein [Planktomarina sp.]|nr:XdhC family protein [Planktomarina sp.]
MAVAEDMTAMALRLQREGQRVALATVIATWGSAPRPIGAQMLICEDGSFYGSVSGGCVEGAVVLEALSALEAGLCRRLRYGVADADAFAVGLACGGEIELVVESVGQGQGVDPALLERLAEAQSARKPIGLRLDLSSWQRELISEQTDPSVFEAGGGLAGDVFTHIQTVPLRLVIIGAVHIAQYLAPMAQMAGYLVTIIDPRDSFASPARFDGYEVIVDWPEEALARLSLDPRTALVTLTHDPKMDTPALQQAVTSDAFYIGALGSTRTHTKRRQSMLELGVSAAQFARIQGPVGLDIGSRNPAEIALSILAAITAKLRGQAHG